MGVEVSKGGQDQMWRVWESVLGDEKVQSQGRGDGHARWPRGASLTLGLHPGAHQRQRVTGHLATGRGECHR